MLCPPLYIIREGRIRLANKAEKFAKPKPLGFRHAREILKIPSSQAGEPWRGGRPFGEYAEGPSSFRD